ncbi:MAG: efflux RND transporter periplasmic adaptor subunit [Candidatus Cyclobacteriaceae bacterium M2_1C_046]
MKKIIIAAIVLGCLAFILIPEIIEKENSEDSTNNVAVAPAGLPVEGIVIEDVALDNNLKATGSLLANESVILRSEVSGLIENIYFSEGQRVKKGQLLVQLTDDEIQAEIEKLRHTRKLNESIESRQKQLLAKDAISQEEYETAQTTLSTIVADLRLKEVQLNKRYIRAPFDGIVGLRSVSEGSYLTPSENIATIYNINPIKIDFSVPGKYASEVNVGDKISFKVDGIAESQNGTIYAVEPQIDPETRTLKIRALSENENAELLPGQFATIQLTLETYDNTIMIPTQAIIPEMDGIKVFIYEGGKAVTRQIKTGIRTADKIQVLEGLSHGDTVITTGTLQMRPGMDITVNL